MMKIQALTLIAALSFTAAAFANEAAPGAEAEVVADTNIAPPAPIVNTPCATDSKGVPMTKLEANVTINESLKIIGGIKGLLYTWETDGGSVRFYPSPAKRFRLDYEFFGKNTAVITKVCALGSGVLKLNGHVSGDPFVMAVGVTSNKRVIKMNLEGKKNGEWYSFQR